MPPVVSAREDQTHLKARWHAAAKEAAYRLLDLRKESWKEYTIFDKGLVHSELRTHYKFDPPPRHGTCRQVPSRSPPQLEGGLEGPLAEERGLE